MNFKQNRFDIQMGQQLEVVEQDMMVAYITPTDREALQGRWKGIQESNDVIDKM